MDGKFLVLDPLPLIEFLEARAANGNDTDLGSLLEKIREVPLEEGPWLEHYEVVRWQASLAVWLKRRRRAHLVQSPPLTASYDNNEVPPPYSEK